MMNVIEVQDALKGMPMEQLIREVQMPSGQVPQFLVLSEITRRREMEKAYAQNQGQPQTTVAQDAVTGAGVPQEGIAGMARAMAPNTDMAQNTGAMPQAPAHQMASGGYVQKMQRGGIADLERAQRNVERSTSARVGTRTSNPRIMQIANMFGITVEDAQRMIENNPELLDILAPPSAMVTAPGVSARPITPVDPRVLPAGYVPEFSRIGRNDEPAMPGPIPLPVGGSTTAEKPDIPSASYRTGDIYTALPAEMEREMARAQLAEDVRGGRAGASTFDASIEGENRRRSAADDRFLFPDPTALPAEMEREIARAQMAEDVRGGRAGANTVGASQAAAERALREAEEAERRRRAAAFMFDVQGVQPDAFTDIGGAFMPSPGMAPTVSGAPTRPQLAALASAAGGGAYQPAPRIPVGAQNLPPIAGIGDTTRGQERAATAYDTARAAAAARMAGFDPMGGGAADYAARMAGEGAVAARRQENETQARSSIVDAMRRDALGERALAGRVGMDTSEADVLASDRIANAPPDDLPQEGPPTAAVQEVMDQFGVSAEDAQEIILRTQGPTYGEAGSSFVINESTPDAPTEEYRRAYDDWFRQNEARRAAQSAMDQGTEVETLEGGTTPDGKVVAPPLPPGRGVVTSPAKRDPPAGIAGAMSPLEGEIANLLKQREKRAEQDKWLALAQAGMALMSSRQPTFAGALGEAGLTGLAQFRKSRDQYEEDRLGLMTAQERLRAARVAAGARAAGAPKLSDISTYYGKRAEIIKLMSDPLTDDATKELLRRELLALERSFLSATSKPFDATVGAES